MKKFKYFIIPIITSILIVIMMVQKVQAQEKYSVDATFFIPDTRILLSTLRTEKKVLLHGRVDINLPTDQNVEGLKKLTIKIEENTKNWNKITADDIKLNERDFPGITKNFNASTNELEIIFAEGLRGNIKANIYDIEMVMKDDADFTEDVEKYNAKDWTGDLVGFVAGAEQIRYNGLDLEKNMFVLYQQLGIDYEQGVEGFPSISQQFLIIDTDPKPEPTETPTPVPTATPVPSQEPSPSPVVTSTPSIIVTPHTILPTETPTIVPTLVPTIVPTKIPMTPTPEPTETPVPINISTPIPTEETTPVPTTQGTYSGKLPQTGSKTSTLMIMTLVGIVLSGISLFKYEQYKKILK